MTLALLAAATAAGRADAVILTGDAGRNTTAPFGSLATPWALESDYGNYLGTPIAADRFVTAAHFGQASSAIVTTDGVSHPVVNTTYLPGTDLVVRQVSVPFTSYASVYDATRDGPLALGDRLAVFGRGTARGDAIAGHGWLWGADDHARSWGTNTFDGLFTVGQADIDAGLHYALGTQFVTADFDANGDPNEGTLSNGDSGGGVFVFKDGAWKLLAVNYGVELFSTSATGPDTGAAVYDARGLYENGAAGYARIDPALPDAVAQQWFASVVPAALTLVAQPLPEPGIAVAAATAVAVLGGRRRVSSGRAW